MADESSWWCSWSSCPTSGGPVTGSPSLTYVVTLSLPRWDPPSSRRMSCPRQDWSLSSKARNTTLTLSRQSSPTRSRPISCGRVSNVGDTAAEPPLLDCWVTVPAQVPGIETGGSLLTVLDDNAEVFWSSDVGVSPLRPDLTGSPLIL